MFRHAVRSILIGLFVFIWIVSTQKLMAQKVESVNNLALGKSYTISVPPTTKWYTLLKKANKPFPDVNKVLTDGIACKGSSFWTSSAALNFRGALPLDVVVDLGKVYSISEITSNHGAKPKVGIVLPKKEIYFVSLDGDKFIKVGQYINVGDPALVTEENRSKFFTGIKIFSSGSIKTKGRYVLVRTYGIAHNPAQPGLVSANYVGHDEITVRAGSFPIGSVELNSSNAISLHKTIDEALTGYPYRQREWSKIFTQTPLRFLLVPHSFNGSKTYQMSVDGVYALHWSDMDYSIKKPQDITFKCSFPDTVEVIDYNKFLPLRKTLSKDKNGRTIITYSYKIKYPKYLNKPFFIVKPKPTVPSNDIGTLTFSWNYRQDGKTYSATPENYTIVLNEKLSAPSPQRFKTGFFWSGSTVKALKKKYITSLQLFKFYQSIGFNWIDGGHSNVAVYKAAEQLKLDSSFGKSLNPNALMPGLFDKAFKQRVQKEAPFIFSKKNKRYGICPTKFLSGKYDRAMIDLAKTKLQSSHDIYDNWEPYMFLKKGCVCSNCKKAFHKRYKLSDNSVNKLWPSIVTDWNDKQHNRFFSEQLGKVMLKTQKYVEIAGQELRLNYKPDYIPAMHPNFFNLKHRWNRVHDPKDYLQGINKIILWSYINSHNPFSPSSRIGNNLAFLPLFDNALNARKKWGRKDKSGHYLPKLYFLQTEYYAGTSIVAPKDYYFTSVLVFIHGFDGYGTWGQFLKQEARYLKQHVKANMLISTFEDIVLDGEIINDFNVTLKQSEKNTEKVLYSRGFKYKNRYFVAVGNDHLDPIAVKVTSYLPGSKLQDKIKNKIYKGDISKGIEVTLPGKSWKFLELRKISSQVFH